MAKQAVFCELMPVEQLDITKQAMANTSHTSSHVVVFLQIGIDRFSAETRPGDECIAHLTAHFNSTALRRLRKDPLDAIDTGSKVKLAVQRITRPKEAAAADKAKEEAKAKAATNNRSGKKAGSWGGLP